MPMKIMELKTRRSGGDTLLICDITNIFLVILTGPVLIAIPFIYFIIPDLIIAAGMAAALLMMDIIGLAVIKWRRPTLVLRGMKRQIEFFADTRCTSKSGELPVGQIVKFMIFQTTSPRGGSLYSFRTFLKNGSDFTAENFQFRFIQESEMNKTVQKLADYSGAPAFDSKGNELPPLSYSL